MYINLTFLIQIGNFVLTYWFLNKYFFKLFLNVLEQKTAFEQALQKCLVRDEELVENLKKEKEQRLIAFQNRIQSAYFMTRGQDGGNAPLAEFVCTHDDTVTLFLCMRESIIRACDGA